MMIDADVMQNHIRDANPIPHVRERRHRRTRSLRCCYEGEEGSRYAGPSRTPNQSQSHGPCAAQRRRSVWAFAAAFVAILVVVGGAALVLRSDDAQVTDEPAPTTTVAEETTAPFDVESLIWSRVPLGQDVVGVRRDRDMTSADSGFEIASIAAGGPGFVAVGDSVRVGTSSQAEDAAVWTSPDGTDWTRLPPSAEVFGGPGVQHTGDVTVRNPGVQIMEDVTAGGPGLVAVGGSFDGPDVVGRAATVWTSEDGINWSKTPYSEAAFGSKIRDEPGESSTWMRDVTEGGSGLVAVGTDARSAAVWTSPDGITWTRVPHDPEIFGHSEMTSVTAGGPGLIAAGFDSGYSSSGIWTSPDGTSWSRAEIEGRYINAVTVGGPGLVAVGGYEDEPTGCHASATGECYAAAWTSVDGITWTPVPYDQAVFGGGDDKQMMRSVTAVGSHLVAVGSSVWTSPDGITWTRTFHDPAVVGAERIGMWSVAAGHHGLVAVGEVDDLITFWTATPGD